MIWLVWHFEKMWHYTQAGRSINQTYRIIKIYRRRH